jgi:hypothetical protein
LVLLAVAPKSIHQTVYSIRDDHHHVDNGTRLDHMARQDDCLLLFLPPLSLSMLHFQLILLLLMLLMLLILLMLLMCSLQ